MEDTDLIARVYPVGHGKKRALKAIEASPLYIAPQHPEDEEEEQVQHGRRDRHPTEPPEESNVSAHHDLPCIELRFSNIPRSTHGRIFGRDPNSDVVLPDVKGLSYHHFSLTFDDANRLIVRDWGSLFGTEVTYDEEGSGKRSNFRWIVGGDPNPQHKTSIIITIDNTIEFRIVAAYHDIQSQEYIDKVQWFRQGTATAEDLFRDLDLPQRPDTELPTGAHTPGSGEIYLKKTIGKGSFGVVTHFWNVSNADEHVLKEPTEKALRRRMVDVSAWRKEARIMGDLSHPNIVQLLWADFTPHPQLRLEYVPGGSLENHEDISTIECVSILRQCLSALEYLHGRDPPIVHRDIKPDNILVQSRGSDLIEVKFGDFGLSRDSYDLSTICGSYKYLAPEIYEKQEYVNSGGRERISYSAAVDIWSLGVVAYEMVCSLPRWYQGGGTAWCEEIVSKLERDLQRQPDGLKRLLLTAMVVISPDLRGSAKDCCDRVSLLSSVSQDCCETPRPTYYAEERERPPFRYRARDHVTGEQQTILWQGAETTSADEHSGVNKEEQKTIRAWNYGADGEVAEAASAGELSSYSADDGSAFSIEPSRRVRSDAPSPRTYVSASRSSQKRPTMESASSSSSGGRHSKRPDRHSKDIKPTSRGQPEAGYPGSNAQGSMHPPIWSDREQDCTSRISHRLEWPVGEEADRLPADNTQYPLHPEAWGYGEQDWGHWTSSIPRHQPGDGVFAQTSQLNDHLRPCPIDRHARQDILDEEAIKAATLLQTLSHDPRTENQHATNFEYSVEQGQFRLANPPSFPTATKYCMVRHTLPVPDPLLPTHPHPKAPPDHLSTRDLLFDREGLVYMVIRQRAVSMRKLDFQLNASQIFSTADVAEDKKQRYITTFKQRGVANITIGKRHVWVPFRDGVFLCQAVSLEDELMPLLSYASLPLPKLEDNYLVVRKRWTLANKPVDGYACLQCGDHVVAYQPSESTINAAHLLKLGGIPTWKLKRFFAAHPEIAKQVCRPLRFDLAGTYISYNDARLLCTYFDLNPDPVKRLMTGESTSVPPDPISEGHVHDTTGEEAADGCGGIDYAVSGNDSGVMKAARSFVHLPGVASDTYSQFTEAGFENGSYLAPADRSYLQLLN
ncbi:Serine/threonine-protein kinase RAD53 [Tolypocladium paradoxum]|uniref:Serine/threonine-protein kinase RAD53 n=1 Tax=Tolypocladium paradoxum TaxID=94208 RepID=A0A2S4KY81_9HYPO|nr:Serine/threonine-protein kinase RAD53 [Tolypocladium paradoxum]